MINKFYGQFNPPMDKTIRDYFPNQLTGNCIEVGAVDGVFISNTLHFEENGWNVLCIEPIPSYFEDLKKNRKNAINYAASSVNSDDVKFTLVTMNNQNKSSISGLEVDDRLIKTHEGFGLQPKTETITVKSRRLDWCIENHFNHETIDFISIDTEGNELDVLKGFDVNKYNIKLLIIENNFNEPFIEEYLNTQGWIKDKRLEVNDFYIKKTK
jgi:FkbM family methyltransferase